MIAAIVPAAGRGSRMGRPKLSLPVGGRPMLERVITALREGGADPVIVVTGPHDPALPAIARSAGAEVCELTEPTLDMRATVENGLRWLEERYHPRPDDAFLLTPGDLPFLDGATVRAVCEANRNFGESIVVPTINSRRGHPVRIAWGHVAQMRHMAPGAGIDEYLRTNAGAVRELELVNPGILHDIDAATDLVAPGHV